MTAPRCWAVVPAAGIGRRIGATTPKQYLEIEGAPLLAHVLRCLCGHPAIAGVAVAVAAGDRHWARFRERHRFDLIEAEGGAERCHSVLNALRALAPRAGEADWVLVHDAARPCLRGADVARLIEALAAHPVGGLFAVPVSDTVKRCEPGGEVIETVERSGLWRAQTPQMFRLGALREALERSLAAGVAVTDEAQAMERAGAAPRVVEGPAGNVKVTGPGDLRLAALYLRSGQGP